VDVVAAVLQDPVLSVDARDLAVVDVHALKAAVDRGPVERRGRRRPGVRGSGAGVTGEVADRRDRAQLQHQRVVDRHPERGLELNHQRDVAKGVPLGDGLVREVGVDVGEVERPSDHHVDRRGARARSAPKVYATRGV
jgi:hypothetical protein